MHALHTPLGRARRYRTIAAILSLTVILVLSISSALLTLGAQRSEQRAEIQRSSDAAIRKLVRQLNHSLGATYTLRILVQEADGHLSGFPRIAEQLLTELGASTILQLAPSGVVREIHPMAGHEQAIGHNLLTDPARSAESAIAIRDRTLTLAGPFELRQGGVAVVGRLPVFLTTKQPTEEFWGFTIALIRLQELLESSGALDELRGETLYRLSRVNPTTRQLERFIDPFAGDPTFKHGPVSTEFSVPNGFWTLEVIPRGGWVSSPNSNLFYLLSGFAILIGLLVYIVTLQQMRLLRRAMHDPLTHLPTRQLLAEHVNAAITQADRNAAGFALYFIDLDEFKAINDQHGHAAGDQVLKAVADRILAVIRNSDIASRHGGDEFVVLAPAIKDHEEAQRLQNALHESLHTRLSLKGQCVNLHCSIGVSLYPRDGKDLPSLLAHADESMYRRKHQGRSG